MLFKWDTKQMPELQTMESCIQQAGWTMHFRRNLIIPLAVKGSKFRGLCLWAFLSIALVFTSTKLKLRHNDKNIYTIISIPTQHWNKTECSRGGPPPVVEDILCMSQIKFLTTHKNPCWESEDGTLNCLPYFQLIGMAKSGTTDLYSRILNHPDVIENDGYMKKEPQWWGWLRYGYFQKETDRKKLKFSEYLHNFDKAAGLLSNTTEEKQKRLITGDGSPMDMWDFRAWRLIPQNRGLREPRYLTPHLIKHINPNVKLIVLLRNPVDRLYSDYYFSYNGEQDKNRTTFHTAVKEAIAVIENCCKTRSLRYCLYDLNVHQVLYNKKTRIQLGFYAVYLREWLSVFPRTQLLIIRTEDYADNISSVMREVFRFLDLRELTDDELIHLNITSTERKRVTESKLRQKSMLTETRNLLERFYQSDLMDLNHLLKDERFLWKKRIRHYKTKM